MCGNKLKFIYYKNIIGVEVMCNYCGSKREKYGWCGICNKEICEDCASSVDKWVHRECYDRLRKTRSGPIDQGTGHDPAPAPGTGHDPGVDQGIGFGPL